MSPIEVDTDTLHLDDLVAEYKRGRDTVHMHSIILYQVGLMKAYK